MWREHFKNTSKQPSDTGSFLLCCTGVSCSFPDVEKEGSVFACSRSNMTQRYERALGGNEFHAWDFSKWQPHAVVRNPQIKMYHDSELCVCMYLGIVDLRSRQVNKIWLLALLIIKCC